MYPDKTIEECCQIYHYELRYKGCPILYPKQIGTTLLVKSLELEHAIVLDAAPLSKKKLYIALTRGSQSLSIISTSAILNPN